MKQIWLIARRDFNSTILSPAGFFILALYLAIAGFLFANNIESTHEASLMLTFSSLGFLTIFIVPVLTMRLFSEELRSGTFEVLVSNPLTDWQIVLGKFIAAWLSFAVLSAPTFTYLFLLQMIGSPDWFQAISGYIGQQLLAMMLIALGLMVSSCTQNQILAALGAMVGGMILSGADAAGESIRGWLGQGIAYLAILQHFALFRAGLVDTRSITFFLFSAIMLLFMTVRIIESRRWKFGVIPGEEATPWQYPRLSISLLTLAFLAWGECLMSWFSRGFWGYYNWFLVFAGLIMIGVASFLNWDRLRLEIARRQTNLAMTVFANCALILVIWGMALYITGTYYTRFDLTTAQRYTISDISKRVASQVDRNVDIIVTVTGPRDLVQNIRYLLDEYSIHTNRLNIHYLDPTQAPGEIESWRQRYNLITPLSEEILIGSGEYYRRLPTPALTQPIIREIAGGIRRIAGHKFAAEAEITSALMHLTREQPGRIIFLSGHGERDPEDDSHDGASRAVNELMRANWMVQHHVVTPGAQTSFPADTEAVIIAGPRRPLSDADLAAVDQVLNRGGGVVMMVDPGVDAGLEPLIHPWEVRLREDIVVDLKSFSAGGNPSMIYVNRFTENHPIGAVLKNLAVVLPGARRVAVNQTNPNPNIITSNFMHTSGDSWAVYHQGSGDLTIDPNRDRRGPISLGMAIERHQPAAELGQDPLQGRMVIIGNSSFMSNQFIGYAGNIDLFMNSVEWAAGRHDFISIRPKTTDARRMDLTARDVKFIYWWSVVLLPGLAVAVSLIAYVRRRHQS